MADGKLGVSAQSTPTIDLSVNRAFVELLPLLQRTFPTLVKEFPGIFQEGRYHDQPNPEIPDAFKKRAYELMAEFFIMNKQYEPSPRLPDLSDLGAILREYGHDGVDVYNLRKKAN